MKKIINGKLYNTETARRVGDWSNTSDVRDFGHTSEVLYLKKTGEFFIHGEGGPASRYAKSAGQNCWTGGEDIVPISYDEAKAWAECKMSVDDYIEVFGMPEE